MEEFYRKSIDFLCTFLTFFLTVSCVPLLFLSYLAVQLTNLIWFRFISLLNPNLQFLKSTTLRTLVDTHRNQGIVVVLLTIQGPVELLAVKRNLQEVVNRRDKHGNLVFPRLRQCLQTRCGTYAWSNEKFDLNQILILAPSTYRGRNITELNIQDCVSEIVSKYLPSGVPPWQVTLIPSSENNHYLLLRMHHVLLKDGINIADLLPLIPPVRINIHKWFCRPPAPISPLTQVFKKPENIPYLKERLTEEFTNRWNEFISNNDPLEQLDLLKTTPGFFQFVAIALITFVSAFKETKKGLVNIRSDPFSKIKFFNITASKECLKRGVTIENFFNSIFVTLNPINIAKVTLKTTWFLILAVTLKIPLMIYLEIVAFFSCIFMKYCVYPNTLIGNIYNYVPLFFYSSREVFEIFKVIFNTPRVVLKEIKKPYETVQTMTLCGRKVIAWSQPVRTQRLREIAASLNITETEVALSSISAAFSRYFEETNSKTPIQIPVCCRNYSSNYIFLTGNNVKSEDSIGGVICIDLPLLYKDRDILKNLKMIGENLREAKDKQQVTYLLSILQTKYGMFSKFLPATFMGACLRFLSRKYAISITEVTTKQPNMTQRTLWGQEVTSAIYFRPPQANISISIILNQYADHLSLGVMCDAQLIPHHVELVRGFYDHIEEIANTLRIQ